MTLLVVILGSFAFCFTLWRGLATGFGEGE